jgi:lipid A 3-O-deacylase
MHIKLSHKYLFRGLVILVTGLLLLPNLARAEAEWISMTMDNDTFVGEDNGYTNGIYVSWFDGPEGEAKAEPGFLAQAMLWSLPDAGSDAIGFDIKTIGQTMTTPNDIELDPPILPPNDMPYGGLLFYTDSYIQIHQSYADKISVTLGVVGEYSFAEESQEFVHGILDADEPCCWDQQLDNEIVFQVSRSRVWKTWVSDSGNADFLLGADLSLGTISSSAGASFMVRYGREMKQSYALTLLGGSRTVNPVATQKGWYLFAGARVGYLANSIFLDGSKSYDNNFGELEYDEDRLMITAGLAYSWKDFSLTFAVNDMNATEDSAVDTVENYHTYGTLTLAWKLD